MASVVFLSCRILSEAFAISLIIIFCSSGTCFGEERKCELISPPYFGSLTGSCSGQEPGTLCNITCFPGYILQGASYRICNESTGRWYPNGALECLDRSIRCRYLHPPPNGYFQERCDGYAGSRCTIGCKEGYAVVNSEHVVCLRSQKWIPSKPRCKRVYCPVPENPANGRVVELMCMNSVAGVCEFSCDAGYYLAGSRMRRCTSSGQWDGEETKCVQTCSALPVVKSGLLWGQCSPGIPGKRCHVLCKKGFIANPESLTCGENSLWNSSLPSCTRVTCPSLKAPVNSSAVGFCKPGMYGRPCIFTCNEGYGVQGSESTYCKANGLWSSEPPVCKVTRCLALPLRTMHIYNGTCRPGVPGDWCSVRCIKGYVLKGHGNITCLPNGTWSHRIPSCKIPTNCPPLKPPRNGQLLNCSFLVGSRCWLHCYDGFGRQGSSYLSCLPSGNWDGKRGKCSKKKYIEAAAELPKYLNVNLRRKTSDSPVPQLFKFLLDPDLFG